MNSKIMKMAKYQNSHTPAENSCLAERGAALGRRIFGFFSVPQGSTLSRGKGRTLIFVLAFLFFSYFPLFTWNLELAEAATIKAPPSNLGLVAYYPMNEGSGTVAGDFSGNGNTGTLVSSPTWTIGKRGNALSFSGSNNISVSHSSSLNINGTGAPITLSAWVYFVASTDSYNQVLAKEHFSQSQGYGLFVRSDRKLAFYLLNSSGNNISIDGLGSAIPVNQWTHISGSYNGTLMRTYINGVLDYESNIGSFAWGGTLAALKIGGASVFSSGRYLNGTLDDVRIYNRALSSTEITTLYRAGEVKIGATQSTGSLATGLVGHWTFDGKYTNWTSATAGTVTDSSGQGNTGTLTNMSQTATPTDGVIGQAGNFDGVNDYVSIGTGINTALNGSFTVGFWTKLRGTSTLFGNRGTSSSRLITYNTHAAGSLSFLNENFTDIQDVAFGQYLNTWAYVAWVYDQTNTNSKVYVNGVQQSSVSFSFPGSYAGSNFIGDDSANFLSGQMDDVRVYNRALTTAEIKRLYNLGRPTITKKTYLLDKITGAAGAYSVRKLRDAYSGYALRVRRSSDSAEQDIGFTGVDLDTDKLSLFCAATDCYVTTWYDQSGNALDVANSTTSQQPQIVSSGAIITSNGKPAVQFTSASATQLNSTNNISPGTTMTSAMVWETPATDVSQVAYGMGTNSNGNGFIWYIHVYTADKVAIYGGGSGSWYYKDGATWDNSRQYSGIVRRTGSASSLTFVYKNGVLGSSDGSLNVINPVSAPIRLGRGPAAAAYYNGKLQEVVVWIADKSAGDIYLDQNRYYRFP